MCELWKSIKKQAHHPLVFIQKIRAWCTVSDLSSTNGEGASDWRRSWTFDYLLVNCCDKMRYLKPHQSTDRPKADSALTSSHARHATYFLCNGQFVQLSHFKCEKISAVKW